MLLCTNQFGLLSKVPKTSSSEHSPENLDVPSPDSPTVCVGPDRPPKTCCQHTLLAAGLCFANLIEKGVRPPILYLFFVVVHDAKNIYLEYMFFNARSLNFTYACEVRLLAIAFLSFIAIFTGTCVGNLHPWIFESSSKCRLPLKYFTLN